MLRADPIESLANGNCLASALPSYAAVNIVVPGSQISFDVRACSWDSLVRFIADRITLLSGPARVEALGHPV